MSQDQGPEPLDESKKRKEISRFHKPSKCVLEDLVNISVYFCGCLYKLLIQGGSLKINCRIFGGSVEEMAPSCINVVWPFSM